MGVGVSPPSPMASGSVAIQMLPFGPRMVTVMGEGPSSPKGCELQTLKQPLPLGFRFAGLTPPSPQPIMALYELAERQGVGMKTATLPLNVAPSVAVMVLTVRTGAATVMV